LGSNLPGRFASADEVLEAALERFAQHGLALEARSSVWRSAAWPDPSAPDFSNMVATAATALDPGAALAALLAIEVEFGRVRDAPNAPRTLDLDLIDHDGTRRDEPGLTLPHPRAHERLFVMGPLAEIAPGWRHPVSRRTAVELAAAATVGLDARPVLPRCNMDR
jgi:2-amino-4-hydroxy-6-hydroxymethyldihydropteridine diphosphokinase